MIEHNPLAAIIARLDRAAVVHRLVGGFRSEIPGYARLPTAVIEQQIVEVARHNVDLCFDTIAGARRLTRRDLEPFRASARDRATEGMPLEDLLHAYRLGGRLGWRAIAEAALPDEQATLIAAAELVMRYVDEVSAAVAQAYLEERQVLVSEDERSARDLFEALVHGREPARRLGEMAAGRRFPLAASYQAFVVRSVGEGGRRHADLAAALRRDGVLALTEGDRVAGLLPAGTRERLRGAPGLVVVAEPLAREELAGAIEEVRAVAELAEARGFDGEIDLARFPLELLLLAAPRHAQRIADAVLGRLGSGEEGRTSELVGTLTAFVAEDFDRRRTAERLHVHPNTLDYRMRRVRELTGLDFRSADALAMLVLAVRQASLRGRPT